MVAEREGIRTLRVVLTTAARIIRAACLADGNLSIKLN
jgi:hypothetical protein